MHDRPTILVSLGPMVPTRRELSGVNRMVALVLAVIWLCAGIGAIVFGFMQARWLIVVLGVLALWYACCGCASFRARVCSHGQNSSSRGARANAACSHASAAHCHAFHQCVLGFGVVVCESNRLGRNHGPSW